MNTRLIGYVATGVLGLVGIGFVSTVYLFPLIGDLNIVVSGITGGIWGGLMAKSYFAGTTTTVYNG